MTDDKLLELEDILKKAEAYWAPTLASARALSTLGADDRLKALQSRNLLDLFLIILSRDQKDPRFKTLHARIGVAVKGAIAVRDDLTRLLGDGGGPGRKFGIFPSQPPPEAP